MEPTAAGDTTALTPAAVDQWRERGFAIVDGLIPLDLIETLRERATERFPTPGTPEAQKFADFGSAMVFPCDGIPAFNQLTLHPRLLHAAAQLLGVDVEGLRLTQSDL